MRLIEPKNVQHHALGPQLHLGEGESEIVNDPARPRIAEQVAARWEPLTVVGFLAGLPFGFLLRLLLLVLRDNLRSDRQELGTVLGMEAREGEHLDLTVGEIHWG